MVNITVMLDEPIYLIWIVLKNIMCLINETFLQNIALLPAKLWFLQTFKSAVRDQTSGIHHSAAPRAPERPYW